MLKSNASIFCAKQQVDVQTKLSSFNCTFPCFLRRSIVLPLEISELQHWKWRSVRDDVSAEKQRTVTEFLIVRNVVENWRHVLEVFILTCSPVSLQHDNEGPHSSGCRDSLPWFQCLGPPTMQPRLGSIWLPSLSETKGTSDGISRLVRRWSQDSVKMWSRLQAAQFCRDGPVKLPERWLKCVDGRSDYVVK